MGVCIGVPLSWEITTSSYVIAGIGALGKKVIGLLLRNLNPVGIITRLVCYHDMVSNPVWLLQGVYAYIQKYKYICIRIYIYIYTHSIM